MVTAKIIWNERKKYTEQIWLVQNILTNGCCSVNYIFNCGYVPSSWKSSISGVWDTCVMFFEDLPMVNSIDIYDQGIQSL